MGKTLQELTIADNFMFGAVMTMPDNCRRMLELSLEISVGSVEINTEKSFLYHPEYKGVRLDVYAKDENNTHYDVEMQVGRCDEKEELLLGDERFTIFLSTKGENRDEISQELIAFLDYVKANLAESTRDFNDNYVRQLQESVKQIKKSREMGVRYMQLQELLRDERAEGIAIGRAESLIDILKNRGWNPDQTLQKKIMSEQNVEVLKHLSEIAIRVNSIEQFMQEMR